MNTHNTKIEVGDKVLHSTYRIEGDVIDVEGDVVTFRITKGTHPVNSKRNLYRASVANLTVIKEKAESTFDAMVEGLMKEIFSPEKASKKEESVYVEMESEGTVFRFYSEEAFNKFIQKFIK